jgi:hypothetical protein
VLYTSIETLCSDILLSVFNYYQLDDVENWNTRLGWCKLLSKLAHVCSKWRRLIWESAFYLRAHILCTNGTPVMQMVSHFPPLPLAIDYRCETTIISALDESGISNVLMLGHRVRSVVLHVPSLTLEKLLVLMDAQFPILEQLSISSTAGGTNLILPKTFLAPTLRHLSLYGTTLPAELSLLSTVSLVTVALSNLQSCSYLLPKHLATQLQHLSQLEELSIGFSAPSPRPSSERELLDALDAPVTLPTLRRFTFRGVSAYLERLVAQIRAPLLEQLDVSFFHQLAFALPHLSDFAGASKRLKLPIAKVMFEHDAVSVTMERSRQLLDNRPSSVCLKVICKHFDWQIDSAAQICGSLMPALSSVERLALDFDGDGISAEWEGGAVDGTTWRELLRPFIGAKELHICRALTWELSSALLLDDTGLEPGLLPSLQELVTMVNGAEAAEAFASFIDICLVAQRHVRLSSKPISLLLVSPSKSVEYADQQLRRAQALFEEHRTAMDVDDQSVAESLLV